MQRIVRLLLVGASAAILVTVFLGRVLAADGSAQGSATPRWIAGLLALDLDVRLGQLLAGLTAVGLTVVASRTSGTSRKYAFILAASFALFFVLRVFPVARRFETLVRTLDAPAYPGLQTSSVVLFAVEALMAVALLAVFTLWTVSLARALRVRMLAAMLVFVSGAVAIEAVSEWAWYAYGAASYQYSAATLLEGTAETAGFILFLDTLLDLAFGSLPVRTWSGREATDPTATR